MQLIIQYTEPLLLDFEGQPSGNVIKRQIIEQANVLEDLTLSLNGLAIGDDEVIPSDTVVVHASLSNAVCGGKGGFGGLLKSMAKQRGKTKTLDYGACRDLNGRRLRHINDEILLTKWKEAKDKGQEFDVEEETATGIDLWYLSLPSWADGVKVDKRKRFLKPRLKTVLCLDWLRARQDGAEPPAGAPDFWGCPRGARCEFAHGESELRGQTLKQIQEERAQEKRDEQREKQEAYMGVMHRAEKNDEELNDLVLAGLRAAKRAKSNNVSSSSSSGSKSATATEKKSETSGSADAESAVPSEDTIEAANQLLTTLSTDIKVNLESFMAVGNSTFGTVFAPHCRVSTTVSGRYYYEVEVLSDGLMQIGWCFVKKDDDVRGRVFAAEGDGVGDDDRSWAYDGFRQLLWHRGESKEYGPDSAEEGWKQGDVVGCYLEVCCRRGSSDVSEVVLSFSLNGVHYGEAFRSSVPAGDGVFIPAVSLDRKERVGLNLGQATFRHYQPLQGSSSGSGAGESAKGGPFEAYEPVWRLISSEVLDANGFSAEGSSPLSATSSAPIVEEVVQSKPVVTAAPKPVDPADFFEVPLESEAYGEVAALERLGLEHLKHELARRGLKSGGTLKERAERLFSVRGIPAEQIDKKLLSKK